MKINTMTATDYHAQGDSLTLYLRGATLAEVLALDTALLEVRTDAGDLVEAFAGFTCKRSVTYTPASDVFTVVLGRDGADEVQRTLAALGTELLQVRGEADGNSLALEDVMTALCELAALMDGQGEVQAGG